MREVPHGWIEDSRRPGTSLETTPVLITEERLRFVGQRGLGAIREAYFVVTAVLRNPVHIFQGIRWVSDDSERADGWHCYAAVPGFTYDTPDGLRGGARERQVFLVFVSYRREECPVAYNWRWEEADFRVPTCPVDYQDRFRLEVIPNE